MPELALGPEPVGVVTRHRVHLDREVVVERLVDDLAHLLELGI